MNQKCPIRLRTAFSMASALTIALCPDPAAATGVSAGTLIQNTATATFTSGASGGTIQSNTVTVKVDELLDVAVAGLTASPVPTGSTSAVLVYSVTNVGNAPEAFRITVDPAIPGNPFDAVIQSIAVDMNANGVYDPGFDQVLANGAATDAIAADATLRVFVLASLPPSATEGQVSQIRLTASAVTGTGTPGTTFAGQGTGGGDAVVGASGASKSGLDSIVASLAAVALTKTASLRDPFGGSQPVPGAIITYTLVAAVSGSGQAENLHVTDVIPSGTTYQSGTLRLGGVALTDASDGDAGTASASGIDVNLGTLAGGSNGTVTFDVKID